MGEVMGEASRAPWSHTNLLLINARVQPRLLVSELKLQAIKISAVMRSLHNLVQLLRGQAQDAQLQAQRAAQQLQASQQQQNMK